MAIIHPRISPPLALQHGGYQLELKLLEILRMGLPDNFDVFHGLAWSTVHNAMQKFGELDLTVVSPQGQILILEVKAGSVYTQNGLLFKDYRQEKPKDIGQQLGRQHGALRKRSEGKALLRLDLPDLEVAQSRHLVADPCPPDRGGTAVDV
jgi:hypothetical protein